MRRISLTLILMLLVVAAEGTVLAQEVQPQDRQRDRLPLGGTWELLLDTIAARRGDARHGEQFPEEVTLPGTLDESGKGFANTDSTYQHLSRLVTYEGPAWYRREVNIPESWAGKHIELVLERTKVTHVWVDDRPAGSSERIFTPQRYDLTDFLTPGRHTLTIAVDNDPSLVPVEGSHAYSENTQTNWNGIIGDLHLEAAGMTRIERVRVFPDIDDNAVDVEVRIAKDASDRLDATLHLAASLVGGEGPHPVSHAFLFTLTTADTTFVVRYPLGEDAVRWSEFDPAYYELHVTLHDGDRAIDGVITPFGLRLFDRRGTQFTINDVVTFLRGKHDAAVFPLIGYPPADTAAWGRVFRIARSYGINHFRFHSYTPPEAAFRAANRAGVYLQTELPIWYAFRAEDPEQMSFMMAEGKRILDAYGNHPSFVMFALGNEISEDRDLLRQMIDEFRAHDPRPLYAQGANNRLWDPSYAEGDDFWVTFRTGTEQSDFSTDVRGAISYLDSDEAGIINSRYPSTDWNFAEANSRSPVPVISHENGQFSIYPNYDEMQKYTGVLRPWNLALFRRDLERAGMLDQAGDFFRASGAFAVELYRADIEAAIRTPEFGGYQLLDLQDFPGQGTALVGILDAFMDSKGLIEPEAWRRFNDEAVLLAEMERYVWTNDETFEAQIKLANYRPTEIPAGSLAWSLVSEDGTVASGALRVDGVPQGSLATIAQISADLSRAMVPQKLTLRLSHREADLATEYPLWIYPANVDTTVPEAVTVTRRLDDETVDLLHSGGRVLLLPEPGSVDSASVGGQFITEFWNYGMFRGLAFQYGDPETDIPVGTMGLLMDPEHALFRDFPTEFHSNWQWWPIAKASRPIILDITPDEYRPIVQTIDNVNRNYKLGTVFEYRVGEGRLLIASVDLPSIQQYPEARQFYASLLRYAASDDFRPEASATAEFLRELLYGRRVDPNDPGRPVDGYTEY